MQSSTENPKLTARRWTAQITGGTKSLGLSRHIRLSFLTLGTLLTFEPSPTRWIE